MTTILANKIQLIGGWINDGPNVVEDDTAKIIDLLVRNYLDKIGPSEDGWATLYKDPNDGRYWVLEYPSSNMHGGGPPMLSVLSDAQAEARFNALLT